MAVVAGADGGPATLFWTSKDAVYSTILEAVPDVASPSPPGSAAPSASAAPSGKKASPKP
jgi:hypothetical protein